MDWGRCILGRKDSSAPLLNPSRNRNNTVCGYVNLIKSVEEFQRSKVPFPVGVLVHLKKLQKDDEIIESLKKGKEKWHKNCAKNFHPQSK